MTVACDCTIGIGQDLALQSAPECLSRIFIRPALAVFDAAIGVRRSGAVGSLARRTCRELRARSGHAARAAGRDVVPESVNRSVYSSEREASTIVVLVGRGTACQRRARESGVVEYSSRGRRLAGSARAHGVVPAGSAGCDRASDGGSVTRAARARRGRSRVRSQLWRSRPPHPMSSRLAPCGAHFVASFA